jgi:hypothetical protein
MSATLCVPQQLIRVSKNFPVATVNITENSGKAHPCVSTVATYKLLKIFTHILNYKSNTVDTLTTAGRSKIYRHLLSKMPIISVN